MEVRHYAPSVVFKLYFLTVTREREHHFRDIPFQRYINCLPPTPRISLIYTYKLLFFVYSCQNHVLIRINMHIIIIKTHVMCSQNEVDFGI